MENLLSGLFGAIIAVLLTELWKYFSSQKETKKQKEVLKQYLIKVIIPCLNIYLTDLELAFQEIGNYADLNKNKQQYNYNVNPIFNSDILKSIGFNGLFNLTNDHNLHASIIDVYHCIDFLAQKNGNYYSIQFHKKVQDHFIKKGLDNYEDCLQHAQNCNTIQNIKISAVSDMRLKENTAIKVKGICEKIVEKL